MGYQVKMAHGTMHYGLPPDAVLPPGAAPPPYYGYAMPSPFMGQPPSAIAMPPYMIAGSMMLPGMPPGMGPPIGLMRPVGSAMQGVPVGDPVGHPTYRPGLPHPTMSPSACFVPGEQPQVFYPPLPGVIPANLPSVPAGAASASSISAPPEPGPEPAPAPAPAPVAEPAAAAPPTASEPAGAS